MSIFKKLFARKCRCVMVPYSREFIRKGVDTSSFIGNAGDTIDYYNEYVVKSECIHCGKTHINTMRELD